MKKIILTSLIISTVLGLGIVSSVFAQGGFVPQGAPGTPQQNNRPLNQSNKDTNTPTDPTKTGNRMPIPPVTGPSTGQFDQLKQERKETSLQKRESALMNTEKNTKEARMAFEKEQKEKRLEFQKKEKEAREQRKVCMTERQADIKALDQERVIKMKELQSACTPKAVSMKFEKPVKPVMEGLDEEQMEEVRATFQEAVKTYNQQIKTALAECKAQIKGEQQTFRERAIVIKEQCSNTERAVLGLATEIPYDQE